MGKYQKTKGVVLSYFDALEKAGPEQVPRRERLSCRAFPVRENPVCPTAAWSSLWTLSRAAC